jgi:hypothetical protein
MLTESLAAITFEKKFHGGPVWTIETVDVNPEKYLAQTKQADLV